MTYERLVEECKALRHKSEQSEAEFFLFLLVAERNHAEVWQGGGCETFDQFLASNHLCRYERYRFFSLGVDRTSAEMALANGAHWTIQAGKMVEPDKAVLDKFAARAIAFVEIEHVKPSEESVRQWAAEGNANGREPQKNRQVSEMARLRAENQDLKMKLRAAEREIMQLRSKLGGKKEKERPQPRA